MRKNIGRVARDQRVETLVGFARGPARGNVGQVARGPARGNVGWVARDQRVETLVGFARD